MAPANPQTRDPSILVLDDDAFVIEMVREFLGVNGYNVTAIQDPRVALELSRSRGFDLVFLDIMMPEIDGMEVLRELRGAKSPPEVVMMTARGDTELVVKAMKLGAFDYLVKPVGLAKLLQTLKNGLARRAIALGGAAGAPDTADRGPVTVAGVVVAGAATHALLKRIRDVARYFAALLVSGPAGSGRTTWVSLIHALSDRAAGRLVVVDCKSLTPERAAAEILGRMVARDNEQAYEAGALKRADGGILVLENVDALPRTVQPALLSFLDTGQLDVPGLEEDDFLDSKLLSTTSRDLEDLVKAGTFSEELRQRLAVITLEIPPLAERKEEIPHLALHFAREYARVRGKTVDTISREAEDILCQYPWSGQVVELRTMMEQAVAGAGSATIELKDLPRPLRDFSAQLPYFLAAQFVSDDKGPGSF